MMSLGFFTSQCVFIENFLVTTTNQTWMPLNTCDQTMAIASNWESWEWPEFGGL
jgi:hypothetical protein